MILIIAPAEDIHALSVAKALHERQHGVRVVILDTREFPSKSSIALTPDSWRLLTSDERVISSDEVSAIWWRRAAPHNISDNIADPTARRFALNESANAFSTISLWPGYRVINPTGNEQTAGKKALQLKVAMTIGFDVPATVITNDRRVAEQFCVEHKNTVFKVLTPPISTFGETRRIKSEHLPHLASLVHAPVIFQEEIMKDRDIRVTAVGDRIFAATVEIRNPFGKMFPDWRLDASAECRACELPAEVVDKIRRLMAELGLIYAAIDLIRTPSGEYYFLEINPSGQFLFVEIDTGQKISMAVAEILLM
jgi:glutathione synthase/RimK-type ligase-like ATP-grasp enzyme